MRLYTYTLRVEVVEAELVEMYDQEALQGAIQHAEDVVNDALPEGYYCKIDGPEIEPTDAMCN